jgi:threonine synthase
MKYSFECTNCNTIYPGSSWLYTCPKCSAANRPELPPKGILKIVYNYESIFATQKREFATLENDKYLKILPIDSINSLSYLKIGDTPLYRIDKLDRDKFPFSLYLKDDSQNPTFSFKDRASDLVCAYAKEQGISTLIAASTGNAGSSLAGVAASQNQRAIIIVPSSAPKAKILQAASYGAKIVRIEGSYDQAYELSIEATEKFGWFNRNTGYNPLTIEGKKTVSLELYSQLDRKMPDIIFMPCGDGVILSGVYKGFEDLLKLGIIDKLPTIVAVQSEKSPNLVMNLSEDKFVISKSSTIADSISVDVPRNFYMAKEYIDRYKGLGFIVTDEEIMEAQSRLAGVYGLFVEPAAAAAFAGMIAYRDRLKPDAKAVVLLTGSGLKDPESIKMKNSKPIKPNLSELERILTRSE